MHPDYKNTFFPGLLCNRHADSLRSAKAHLCYSVVKMTEVLSVFIVTAIDHSGTQRKTQRGTEVALELRKILCSDVVK